MGQGGERGRYEIRGSDAKHHDGFCLFDSQYTDFKSTNTKCGRDLVAEYVDAVRAEGLKVGLYFSLLDWFHDDFPHYGDRNHPMRNNPAYKNDDRDFDRYLTYMHNQVREICTNYGSSMCCGLTFPTIRCAAKHGKRRS